MQIVVVVEGGNVTGVLCSDPAAEVEIVDYDDRKAEGRTDEFTNPDNLASVY
jgi:hypothetical protein